MNNIEDDFCEANKDTISKIVEPIDAFGYYIEQKYNIKFDDEDIKMFEKLFNEAKPYVKKLLVEYIMQELLRSIKEDEMMLKSFKELDILSQT
jgi:hypothetical protein